MKKSAAKLFLSILISSLLNFFTTATNIALANDHIQPQAPETETEAPKAAPEPTPIPCVKNPDGSCIETSDSMSTDNPGPSNSPSDSTSNDAAKLGDLGDALKDAKEKPCVQEIIYNTDGTFKPGPDEGYVIARQEEPLTIDERGKTPQDEYVVRRCWQNTFQFTTAAGKSITANELSRICSTTAKSFLNNNDYLDFSPKLTCKEIQVSLCRGGTSCLYGYIGSIYRWGGSIVGIIAVTVIIFSGIQISSSGGDPEAVTAGKKRILQSIIGIVVLFLSGLILYTINPNFFVK